MRRNSYCACEINVRDWYGVAKYLTGPVGEEIKPWVAKAERCAGLIICQSCGGVAPWRGEDDIGQVGLLGAAGILWAHYGPPGEFAEYCKKGREAQG